MAYRQGIASGYSMYDLTRLAVVPAAGGKPSLIAGKLDRMVSPPLFSLDGNALLTTIEDDRNEYLAEVPIKGGEPKRLTSGLGSAAGLSAAAGHLALLYSTDTTAQNIYAADDNSLRQLTFHNKELLDQLTLAPASDISAKSKDGTEVHGLLTMPVGYQSGTKAPMLLRIHGGPTSQESHEFDTQRQLFAAHGYAVLNVNYRGSTGRGHDYSNTIAGDWGK